VSRIPEIIEKAKKGESSVEDILEKRKAAAAKQLEMMMIERMLEEEKKKLEDAKKSSGEAVEGQRAKRDFVTELLAMAQIDPEKAKRFLESLSEEDMSKLALLGAGGGSNLNAFLALSRSPSSSVRDMIDVAKLMISQQPQQQLTLEGVAKLVEATKGRGETTPSQAELLREMYKEFVLPVKDEMNKLREQYATERTQALEAKITELANRPGLVAELTAKHDELLALREVLGGGGGGQLPADVQLKLKEMELGQARELEKMKQDYSMKVMEHADEREKWVAMKDILKDTLEGPIGKTIEKIGGAGADRVRGPQGESKVKVVQTTCPTCQKSIYVLEAADTVVCPSCGSVLQKKVIASEQPVVTPGGPPVGQPATEKPPESQ
jgi:predicted RNA-binding Zn-ribbon protein involved in translation (DUF1610 family)